MTQAPDKVMKLYGSKIEIGFWKNRHRYSLIKNGTPENTWLTSVTAVTGVIDKSVVLKKWVARITKEFLTDKLQRGFVFSQEMIDEACNLYNIKQEEAATKGTLAHDWIEKHIKGEKPELPDDDNVAASINAFIDWEKQHQVKWLASEKIVYSKKYSYVGLLDALAVIDRKTKVIDFKTSSGVYNDFRYQIAAYRAAHEEETGKKLSGDSIIVRFDKETAKFEVHECPDYDKDFKAFLGALAVKQREKELDAIWRSQNK